MKLQLEGSTHTPLYIQLSDALRRAVESGTLKPGDRLPSIAQLREHYGLHKKTIEQAHQVLEKEGIVVREQGRGTFVSPSLVLPSRAMPPNPVIGFCGVQVITSQSSPFWLRLLDGIWSGLKNSREAGDEASPANQAHLLLFDRFSPAVLEKVDGLLINGQGSKQDAAFITGDKPTVSLLVRNQLCDISSVVADDHGGGKLLTRHLLKLGHRRIAFLYNRESRIAAVQRLQGYRDAMHESGIAVQPGWVHSWPSETIEDFTSDGYHVMSQWLARGWQRQGCTALICQNDEVAVGAIKALQEHSLQVPRDVSVVGFDGIISRHVSPRLTTVELPLREMGRAAAGYLLENPAKDDIRHIKMPVTLRVGQTSAPPSS